MEQVQGAKAQLRNLFYSGNLLIFGCGGTFWKSLLIWCVYTVSLKLGFCLLESYPKFMTAKSGRGLGFFSLYDYGACCIALVFINVTVLKQQLVKGKRCGDLFETD